jgi:peptidyl-prolyl cis-trans isomerase D
MLRILRQGQRWIMAFVIVFIGGVFVVFFGPGNPFGRRGGPAAGAVLEVGDRSYDNYDLDRMYRLQARQYQKMLGEDFEQKIGRDRLTDMAAQSLLQQALLAEEAERLGIRVSEDELRALVRSIPIFQDQPGQPGSGKATYDRYVQQEYGSHGAFNRSLRDEILAQKAARLITRTAAVSEAEARDAVRLQHEEVELALVVLDPAKPPGEVEVTDEQVKELLAKDEARVRKAYETQSRRFHVPERVRARHILFRVKPDAPPDQVEAARKKAEEALAAIRGGADFATVARERSEDPSTKDKGGELGFFSRGQMVKPFEEAAFALAPGQVSDVVRTDFGFHLIQVEAKEPPKDQSFEEVRETLARELLRQDAGKAAVRKEAESLAAAVKQGKSLEDAAREDGLTLTRPGPLHWRPDGLIPEVGVSPDLFAAAFALRPEHPSSDRIFEVGDKLVLAQLLSRKEPNAEDVAKEAPAMRERMLQDERQRIEATWLEARRNEMMAAGEIRMDLSKVHGAGGA